MFKFIHAADVHLDSPLRCLSKYDSAPSEIIRKALDNPANMKMLSSRKVETIRLDNCGLAIHGRSFGTQHVDKNLVVEFGAAEKGMFNIDLLHTSLDVREGHALYAPCTTDDLRSKGYQYWALGHVHRQEFVSEEPYRKLIR